MYACPGQYVEALGLERAQVLRADLRRALGVGDLDALVQARFPRLGRSEHLGRLGFYETRPLDAASVANRCEQAVEGECKAVVAASQIATSPSQRPRERRPLRRFARGSAARFPGRGGRGRSRRPERRRQHGGRARPDQRDLVEEARGRDGGGTTATAASPTMSDAEARGFRACGSSIAVIA